MIIRILQIIAKLSQIETVPVKYNTFIIVKLNYIEN